MLRSRTHPADEQEARGRKPLGAARLFTASKHQQLKANNTQQQRPFGCSEAASIQQQPEARGRKALMQQESSQQTSPSQQTQKQDPCNRKTECSVAAVTSRSWKLGAGNPLGSTSHHSTTPCCSRPKILLQQTKKNAPPHTVRKYVAQILHSVRHRGQRQGQEGPRAASVLVATAAAHTHAGEQAAQLADAQADVKCSGNAVSDTGSENGAGNSARIESPHSTHTCTPTRHGSQLYMKPYCHNMTHDTTCHGHTTPHKTPPHTYAAQQTK